MARKDLNHVTGFDYDQNSHYMTKCPKPRKTDQGRTMTQKTSDSLGNLHVEETNVDGAPELLSNKFLAFDTQFNSEKMSVGFGWP